MTRIAIHGAAGRMGRRLVALTLEADDLTLAAAIEAAGSPSLGEDAGVLAGAGQAGVAVASAWSADDVDVVIDFTVPAATRKLLAACVERGVAAVIGTTGLTDDDMRAIENAGRVIPVLAAPNMSLGVNLLFALAARAARTLGDDYDIEVVEAHHRFKKDAPSGTAWGIVDAICQATGRDRQADVVHGRHGDETTRVPRQIGVHALRLGDTVGDHTASFATPGERIELRHVATNRDVFVHGALRAARWLAGQSAGRYRMADVLDLAD